MTQTNPPQKFSYYWLATIFLVLVVVVGLITATAAGMRATIKIDTTTPIATKNENWQIKFEDEKLSVEPSNLNFQPISVEVSTTESFTPIQGEEKDGFARGEFTLINNSGNPQALVATTRLLTKDNILFRLEKAVNIPAGGKITAIAKADVAGASGNIESGTLTIPGLSKNLQDKIYAENAQTITGGTIKTGVISQDDLTTSTESLKITLAKQALEKIKTEAEKSENQDFKLVSKLLLGQIISQTSSADIGEKTDNYTTTLKMKFTALLPKISEVNSLIGQPDSLDRDIDNFDWKFESNNDNSEAKIELSYQGKNEKNSESPTIDKRQLTFKNEKKIRQYLQGQNLEINDLKIEFKPSWLHFTPITAKNLTVEIN